MASFLRNLFNKLQGKEDLVDIAKIERPPGYYETERHLKKNLQMFIAEIEKIKDVYEPYSFQHAFKMKFGAELNPEDFHYQERIAEYITENQVPEEKLQKFRNERLQIREKINHEISQRITLAKSVLFIRDGNCPDYMLSKAARLEGIYGEPAQAAKYRVMFKKASEGKMKIPEGIRWEILDKTSTMLTKSINPYGQAVEAPGNWEKQIDFIEEKLLARGITFEEPGRQEELRELWQQSQEMLKKEQREPESLGRISTKAQALRSEKTVELQQEEPDHEL